MEMEEEKYFNVNTMLKNLFDTLDQSCTVKRPNLVFYFSKNVPCQMKGEVSTLYTVLLKTLRQIIKNECTSEILLSVDAPEEFLHEENVTFKIMNIPIKKEKILPELERQVHEDLERLDASLAYIDENGGSIELVVPLKNAELGCRRHYRMPSKTMLDKNILLVIEGNNLALSLTKMFKYFPMNIDLCLKRFKQDKYDLTQYDMVLVEDTLFDFQLEERMKKAKNESAVKFVMLGNKDIYEEDDVSKLHTLFLEKPVTQESVFNLLVSLFEELPILT